MSARLVRVRCARFCETEPTTWPRRPAVLEVPAASEFRPPARLAEEAHGVYDRVMATKKPVPEGPVARTGGGPEEAGTVRSAWRAEAVTLKGMFEAVA